MVDLIFRQCGWLVFIATLGFVSACATVTPPPNPTSDSGTLQEQLTRGAPLYAQNCATAMCHGTQGEGLRAGDSFSAWPLVGKEFAARNPTAQVIFDVVRSGGEQNLRAMTDQQIYDAIAFELSEHGTRLTSPLTASNATLPTGNEPFNPNVIYPPLDNVKYIVPSASPRVPWVAANNNIELRVNQLALTSTIGDVSAPRDAVFVIIVFAIRNFSNRALDIEPRYLHLYDSLNNWSESQAINLYSAYEQFHPVTIFPEFGTASIAVFGLLPGATYTRLVYDDQTGHALALDFSK